MGIEKDFGKLAEQALELDMTFEEAMRASYRIGMSRGEDDARQHIKEVIRQKINSLFDLDEKHQILKSDQSCMALAKICEDFNRLPFDLKPFDPNNKGLSDIIVGTYSLAIDGVDVGRTTGGCDFTFSENINGISTTLLELPSNKLEELIFNRDKEVTVTVLGPGPNCGTRTLVFENCKVTHGHIFKYSVKTDQVTNLNISYQTSSKPTIVDSKD